MSVAEDTYRALMEPSNERWKRIWRNAGRRGTDGFRRSTGTSVRRAKRAVLHADRDSARATRNRETTMAEKTILICDGCELPQTSKKPVYEFLLSVTNGEHPTQDVKGDAHDWNCFGRIISRRRKAQREIAKAAAAAKPKKPKK